MSELTPEDALTRLFDSDAWQTGLTEADPAEAARFICDWLYSSGFTIVDARKVRSDPVAFIKAVQGD
jgi:hypothetical protein